MSSKTQTGFDVLIIGAGICGLTTATALAQKGHRVRVLEHEGALNDFGASITILPSATRLLLSWGLEDGLKKYGTPIRCFTSKDGATGEVIGHTPCNIGNTAQISFNAEWWNIRRADYQMLLMQAAEKCNAKIIFDTKLKEIDIKRVRTICKDDRDFSADVIIGADGIDSMTRKHIGAISGVHINEWPEHCYRCTVSKNKMYGNPLLEVLLDPAKADGTSYMHDGKYVLTWQMRPEAPFEMVAGVSEKAPDIPTGKWGIRVSPEEVQDRFSHFCSQINVPLKYIESVMKWNIGDLPVLETWRSPNGRVVLAGDAAHAMIPHAASGSLSAIEDAAVLAETLTWAFQHGRPVGDATESYERIRKPRVTRLQEISRDQYGFLGASGEAAKARDAMLRELDRQMWETLRIPEEERRKMPRPEPDMMAQFPAQWIYGYDAIQDARKYLAKLSGS